MFLYGLDASGHVTTTFGPYERSGPLPEGSFRSWVIPGVEAVLEVHGLAESATWPMRIPWIASINAGLLADLRAAGDPSLSETPAQRSPARGEKIPVEYRGRMVTAEVIDGDIVFEGDIVIGTVNGKAAGNPGQPVFSLANTSSSAHWPGGVIPFVDTLPNTRGQAARDHWTQITNGTITFVPRTSEASYVKFIQPSNGVCSSSSIGRTSGVTTIKLGIGCSTGTRSTRSVTRWVSSMNRTGQTAIRLCASSGRTWKALALTTSLSKPTGRRSGMSVPTTSVPSCTIR